MPAGEVIGATPEFDSPGSGVQVHSGVWGRTGHIFFLAKSIIPPSFMWLIISFPAYVTCSSHNFKSTFPAKLPPTNAILYGHIRPPGDGGEGKVSGKFILYFLHENVLNNFSFIYAFTPQFLLSIFHMPGTLQVLKIQ